MSNFDDPAHPVGHDWMCKSIFTAMNLKLLSSFVAIAALHWLKSFMDLKTMSDRELMWLVVIHMVFVVSGIILAWTDKVSGEAYSNGKKSKEKA